MKSRIRIAAVGLCALCFMCMSGCGKNGINSITIAEEEIYMDVGSACNLEAAVSPKAASGAELSYHTSDESIAEYNNDLVIAHKPGTCTLYVASGDVISNFVKVNVHDFVKEATELRESIESYYVAGLMSKFIAEDFSSKYEKFPEYAKRMVDNFYIVSMFKHYSGEEQVYITKSGSRYHEYGCRELQGEVREIPYQLAELEELLPCETCSADSQG